MHIAIARRVGRARYSQLPQWLDDGYADYVARDIDYRQARQKMEEGACWSPTCWTRRGVRSTRC
jgi:hypothetical protein